MTYHHNWTFERLGELVETNSESYSEKEQWDYIHYLDTGNITDNRIKKIIKLNVGTDKIPSRAKRKVKPGDVIISNVMPNQRHFGIIKSTPPNFLVSTGFTTIRAYHEKARSDFVFWYLSQLSIVEYLQGIAENTASVFPAIKSSDIENLTLFVPPLSEQKAIASVLSALDDKIENNLRINDTLEKMAQAIFKSWFIDFDPVHAKVAGKNPAHMNAETATLFPNSFDDNGLPMGWKLRKMSELFDFTMGQSPPSNTYNEKREGIPFWQGRRDFGFRFPSNRIYCTAPIRLANEGDTLVSVRAPVGDVNRALERCCIGRGVAALMHKSKLSSYTYYTAMQLKEQFEMHEASGTVFGSISKAEFGELKVTSSECGIEDVLESTLSSFDNKILNNHLENETLAELRDILLPKLMSGQIRIADVEREVEAV